MRIVQMFIGSLLMKKRLPLWAMATALLLLLAGFAITNSLSAFADEMPNPRTSAETPNWQALLDRAEPLYLNSNYKDVLPTYEQAAKEAVESGAPVADQIKCLRYLADCYCRLEKPDDALAQYEKVGKLLCADDIEGRIVNTNCEALCFGLKGDYDKAQVLCNSSAKLCEGKDELLWELTRTQAQVAYLDYQSANYTSAISGFQTAERTLDKSGRSDLLADVMRQKLAFAQAGSYYHLKRYAQAYPLFKRMYELDVRLFGKTDLQTGWAMMALSDVLEKINQREQAADWYRKSIFVFRKFNKDGLCKELAARSPSGCAEIQERVNKLVFGNSMPPADLVDTVEPLCNDSTRLLNMHDPRSMYARPFADAPGKVWINPMVEQHGAIIAIHGLSLNHSSYDAFARELADMGFCTIAFDIRGFGAYRQALGAEQMDFDGCMRDLQMMVGSIRADHPGVPLFILGESMGGAIAMQFAAQNPKLVDGLIASVPAGRRFKEKLTALKVAIRFLENKNRPFDIGTDVINQATHDPRVKAAWAGDPKTRSMLSPRELIEFQSMCNRNIEFAKQIDVMPVIIFQGVSDMLVKPEATYDLFRAIAVKDKSLVMVGNAEHLIFEEGCFTPPVLKGLAAWMESHKPQLPASSAGK